MYQISYLVQVHNIPDVLILNADQTPSKYVTASKVTTAKQREKHIPVAGGNDKRAITLTVIQSLSCVMLPLQVIYQGESERCLPEIGRDDPNFVFPFNKNIGAMKRRPCP